MKAQTLIQACKDRAVADYDTFHMFVECYGADEWREFVFENGESLLTKKECFRIMDVIAEDWSDRVAEAWVDRQADADHYRDY